MENLIIRTALHMIENLVDTRYEYLDSPDVMKMTIGEIGGTIEMTNEAMEALENKNKNE